MPILYRVQAEVVDINFDAPLSSDGFFVDTNVWFWLHYTKASQGSPPPHAYQVTTYPSYLARARKAKAKILHSGWTLAELAHQIERTEHAIWKRLNGNDISLKEFRHTCNDERATVVEETVIAWEQIRAWSTITDCNVNQGLTDASLGRIQLFCIDGYDALLLGALRDAGIYQIITDDGDFTTVPHLQVFTANKAALRSAELQGKLARRR